MKRLCTLLLALILICGVLVLPASAESVASKVDVMCNVNSEGGCFVTMNVTLRLDSLRDGLTFPLPANAKNITLNNSAVGTTKTDSAILVNIGKITDGYIGEASMRLEYTIEEAVKVDPDAVKLRREAILKDPAAALSGKYPTLRLDIPLLSGFELPVEELKFTITMPSSGEFDPVFYSIYRQNSVASDLTVKVDKSQIIGSSKVAMNAHEGVSLTMAVTEEMFPTVSTYIREGNPELTYILVFAGLALLYWILTLRTWPIKRIRTSTAPEGITAGELGCRLTLSGGDLTMMVFSWAQLGYITISVDKNARVLLHKRMDMGNERSKFENNIYKQLFGRRQTVDATGNTYALLCRKVARIIPEERNMYRGNSGNMKIFRALACAAQMACGVCVAMNLSPRLWLATIMAVILAVFGMVSAWLIQDVAYRTHLRGKVPVLIGLVCMLIWISLGFLCGQIWIPLGCTLGQWLFGYFAAYGGRRSDLGRHDAGQVLGLRRYVKRLPREDISRLLRNDPEYYFNLAPYALAMGVINPYSKAFGRRTFDHCPYIDVPNAGKHTAEEWGHMLADIADIMDYRARRMQLEKWIPFRISIQSNSTKKKKRT